MYINYDYRALFILLRLVNMSRISLKSCHGSVFTNADLNEISHLHQSLLLLLLLLLVLPTELLNMPDLGWTFFSNVNLSFIILKIILKIKTRSIGLMSSTLKHL